MVFGQQASQQISNSSRGGTPLFYFIRHKNMFFYCSRISNFCRSTTYGRSFLIHTGRYLSWLLISILYMKHSHTKDNYTLLIVVYQDTVYPHITIMLSSKHIFPFPIHSQVISPPI
jgi:hypothetical protein